MSSLVVRPESVVDGALEARFHRPRGEATVWPASMSGGPSAFNRPEA